MTRDEMLEIKSYVKSHRVTVSDYVRAVLYTAIHAK